MKIDGVNYPTDVVKQSGTSDAEKVQENQQLRNGAEKAGQSGGENVSLSERARHILKAQQELENVPDLRSEKVNQIKEQIANGTYEVKGQEVAEKIIYEALFSIIA